MKNKAYKILERVTLAKRYKEKLVAVLSEVDSSLLEQAIVAEWGEFAGRVIKTKTGEVVKRYLTLLKEKVL